MSVHSQASHLMGIDGGGTKTEALLTTLDGTVLGRGIGGPSNYHKIGMPAAVQSIAEALAMAYAEAGIDGANAAVPVAAVAMGMAGVDREEDAVYFRARLARRYPGIPTTVVNDAELVLPAGTPEGWGIGVICGTGATIVGRNKAGEFARADGWGFMLGDDGSGFWIGMTAMRAILQALDGRAGQTVLTEKVLGYWEITEPADILDRVYLRDIQPDQVAALAVIVTEAAEEGDTVAVEIMNQAGSEIARSIDAVVRRLGLTAPVPIGLAGGVMIHSKVMQEATLTATRLRGLELAPVTLVDRPVLGAIRLAQDLLAAQRSQGSV